MPSLTFSDEIARYKVGENESLYVCAFQNSGKRAVLDVEVITRVGVESFENASGWQFFSLKTNTTRLPILEAKRRALVRIFDQREERQFVDPPSFALGGRIKECKTLDDVFDISKNVVVEIHVFAYDSFSGARRHYVSASYKGSDIRKGRFQNLVVVAK